MTTYGQPFMHDHVQPPAERPPWHGWLFGAVVLLAFLALMLWTDGCGGVR